MRRPKVVAKVVLGTLAYGAPLVLVDNWPRHAGALVAWLIISVAITVFVVEAVVYIAQTDEAAAPTAPVIPEAPTPWRDGLVAGLGLWGVWVGMLVLYLLMETGFGAFAEPESYGLALGAGPFLVLLVLLLSRFGMVNQAGIDAQQGQRRRARHDQPSDQALLDGLDAAGRDRWLLALRRRALRVTVARRAFAVPAAAALGLVVADQVPVLPAVVFVGAIVGAALLMGRGWRGDPLLLVGRITTGLYGVVVTAAEPPDGRDALHNFITHGSSRTITVEVDAAHRIARDATLVADPKWHGTQEIGARRRVLKRAIEGEEAVLLCAPHGLAIGLLRDLRRGMPAEPHAPRE